MPRICRRHYRARPLARVRPRRAGASAAGRARENDVTPAFARPMTGPCALPGGAMPCPAHALVSLSRRPRLRRAALGAAGGLACIPGNCFIGEVRPLTERRGQESGNLLPMAAIGVDEPTQPGGNPAQTRCPWRASASRVTAAGGAHAGAPAHATNAAAHRAAAALGGSTRPLDRELKRPAAAQVPLGGGNDALERQLPAGWRRRRPGSITRRLQGVRGCRAPAPRRTSPCSSSTARRCARPPRSSR